MDWENLFGLIIKNTEFILYKLGRMEKWKITW